MNTFYVGIAILFSFVLWISHMTGNFFYKKIKEVELEKKNYYESVHNIVDKDFINEGYTFTGIVCTGNRYECFNQASGVLYDGNILKEKYVVYFLSEDLDTNFFVDNNWYKNYKNVNELYEKVLKGIFIPENDKLGNYSFLRNKDNINNRKYKDDFKIMPF